MVDNGVYDRPNTILGGLILAIAKDEICLKHTNNFRVYG
jgi:hypothetical protein